jgi:hypothetical protein
MTGDGGGSRPRRSNLRAALYALYLKLKKRIWELLEDLFEVRRRRGRAPAAPCRSRCRVGARGRRAGNQAAPTPGRGRAPAARAPAEACAR